MKRLTIVILCLALLSLACLQSAGVSDQQLAISLTPTILISESAAGAVYDVEAINDIVPTLTKVSPAIAAARTCARVTAVDALHLRKGPSENDIVLAWLNHGDLVQVLDQSDPDWWFIESRGVSGYARSIYLQIGVC